MAVYKLGEEVRWPTGETVGRVLAADGPTVALVVESSSRFDHGNIVFAPSEEVYSDREVEDIKKVLADVSNENIVSFQTPVEEPSGKSTAGWIIHEPATRKRKKS